MAHEIESTDNLFNVGSTPWHGLGVVFDTPPASFAEAGEEAGLIWNVEKQPLYLADGSEVPANYAVVRNDRKQASPCLAWQAGVHHA